MSWIESHQAVRDHPKTLALTDALFDGTVSADVAEYATIGVLHSLWWWALDYASDGDLSRYSDQQIARGCRWSGDPVLLVHSLLSIGFIDEDRTLHDWSDYAGKLIERRSANAKRMRKARAAHETDTSPTRDEHVRSTCDARAQAVQTHVQSDLPTYLPTKDKRTMRDSANPAPSPKVEAPKETDWQQRADEILAMTAFPLDYQRLAGLLAAGNKTGKVSVSRVVRELYEPLIESETSLGPERMKAGLRAAISRGAPNANYVLKAAEGAAIAGTTQQRRLDVNTYDDPLTDADRAFLTDYEGKEGQAP